MNLRILLFFLLSCLTLSAQNKAITLTITNAPVTGDKVTVQASVRTWTNAQTSTTILTNGIINNSTTNLYSDFGLNPVTGVRISYASSNAVTFTAGTPGAALTVTVGGSWASLSSSTNATLPATNLSVPAINSSLTAVDRTNVWSQAIRDLSDYGTGQGFGTNAPALSNYVTKTTGQTVSNKIVRASRIENSTFTNGPIYGTSGAISNLIAHSLISSNGQNFGNAFSSPGTAAGSEQFGSGAGATGTNSTAVGNGALAKAPESTAIGNGAIVEADATNGVALGRSAIVDFGGENGIAVGKDSLASARNALAIGTSAQASNPNSIAYGNNSVTTASNQFVLGAATHTVIVRGQLTAPLTNSTYIGDSNVWIGARAEPATRNTALANGFNQDIKLTNIVTFLSGPSAAFTNAGFVFGLGNQDGQIAIVINTNPFPMAILNESGLETTTNNRALTGTAGTIVMTNNPGSFELRYIGAPVSRWYVMRYSN